MNKGKQTMYSQQICEEVWKEKVNKSDCLKKEAKKRVKKKRKLWCQSIFGSFLVPSSTIVTDESQERTKILLDNSSVYRNTEIQEYNK